MRIFIIILLMNIVGCSSVLNSNIQHKSNLSTNKNSNSSQNLMPVGLWEGISREGAEFKVLNITKDNQHSFTSYNIASGMQFKQSILFKNENITCDEFNCHILTFTADENLPLKITVTKVIEQNYLVTEATKLASGGIYSASYDLKPIEGQSTPERFITQESKEVKLTALAYKKERFGYWSGILEIANEDQLKFATLNYQPGEIAMLKVYTPGLPYQAIMTFDPNWLKQNNGELSTKLNGNLFASEITIRYPLIDVIEGDFEQRFERYPERLLGYGNFRLNRVKPIEEYKLPKWLKNLQRK